MRKVWEDFKKYVHTIIMSEHEITPMWSNKLTAVINGHFSSEAFGPPVIYMFRVHPSELCFR